MKIKYPLYQFNKERAILAVLGRKKCLFYYASEGLITEEEGFGFEIEHYSDKEGFFLKSSRGNVFGSGVPLKYLKEHQRNKFLKLFSDKLGRLADKKNANFIYIFSPRGLMPSSISALSEKNLKILKMAIPGNVTKKHPIEIIQRIENFLSGRRIKRKIVSEEAEKIISRSAKARKVIKGGD